MSIYVADDSELAVAVTVAVVVAIVVDSDITVLLRLIDVSFISRPPQSFIRSLPSSLLTILFDEFVQLIFLKRQ